MSSEENRSEAPDTDTNADIAADVDGGGGADTEPNRPDLPSARLALLAAAAAEQASALVALPAADRTGLGLLPPDAVDELLRVVDASLAESSKSAYRADWRRFTAWASAGGLPPLPAPPAVVAAYVTAAAAEQNLNGTFRYRPATLTRWVSAINQVHAAADLDPPGRSELVRRALAGIRRIRATPPSRRAPLLLTDIRALVEWLGLVAGGWPTGVAARRDTLLLLVGFAGAFRRSELAGLTLADVTLHQTDGLHIRLRSSKTDQEAAGRVVAVPYGRNPTTCPPCAFVRWRELLHAADTADPDGQRRAVMRVLKRQAAADRRSAEGSEDSETGAGHTGEPNTGVHVCRTTRLLDPADPARAVFPTVHKTGQVGGQPMTGHAVRRIIRRRAEEAGYTPEQVQQLGGHSLRAGFVTEAFRAGADAHAIMRQTGHRSHTVLEGYAREHAPLVNNAITKLAL